jgi:hypothetical protein
MHQRRSILHSMIFQAFIMVASICRHASSSAAGDAYGVVVDWTEKRRQSRRRRSLGGDITARIGRGGGGAAASPLALQGTLWQEFRHGAASVGSAVTPCPDLDYCSSSEQAQPLESLESPWTFSLTSSCMTLTVMEGYHSGQAVYHVADKGRFLGSTLVGTYSEDCWDDPVACKALPPSVVGRGSWLLTPGNHSLTITIGNLTSDYPEDVNDGGWFQLAPASCPVAPTPPPPPTCSILNKGCVTSSSSSSCCRGLMCRKALVTSGPLRCLKCIPRAQKCTTTGHCCTGLRCLPVKSGSTSRVCK